MIHPTAVIDPEASLGESVEVGAYAVVGPRVTLGDGCNIGAHAIIESHARIGKGTRVFSFASVGTPPQDLKFQGEETWVEIGDGCTIREYVTVNRGTVPGGGVTRVGNGVLLMAYCHIAHDCHIGDHAILANAASLGGHVDVEDWAILGGFTIVHQFCRIGAHSFSAMGSVIGKDVPPFVMVGGHPAKPHGTNAEGLRRRGFGPEALAAIKRAYKRLYLSGMKLEEAVATLGQDAAEQPELRLLVDFLRASERSIVR